VIDSEPSNHNLIRVTYVARGRHYSGDNGAHDNGPGPYDAHQFHAGSRIQIIYDASNPEVYCTCSAAAYVQQTEAPLIAVVLGVLIFDAFPFVLVWALVRRFHGS
jgi:hypothetical protein